MTHRLTMKIACFAALYILLYEATGIVLSFRGSDDVAAMLFLPAFVRLLSFLLIGFWSVPALFVAALWCIDLGLGPFQQTVLALFLAVGGPMGAHIASRYLKIASDLRDLTPAKLLILSIACCLGSSSAYHLGLWAVGFEQQSTTIRVTTFVGDIAGTWIIIYSLKIILTFSGLARRS